MSRTKGPPGYVLVKHMIRHGRSYTVEHEIFFGEAGQRKRIGTVGAVREARALIKQHQTKGRKTP